MKNIKKLIANKLSCIDFANENAKGKMQTTRWHHELQGIKQTLHTLGITLAMNVNPYYYEDHKPSTFELTIIDE